MSQNTSPSEATGYGLDGWISVPERSRNSLFTTSRRALGTLSPWLKWSE